MAKLSAETKKRLNDVINVGKTVFHWGFIPTVLYLGKTNLESASHDLKDVYRAVFKLWPLQCFGAGDFCWLQLRCSSSSSI